MRFSFSVSLLGSLAVLSLGMTLDIRAEEKRFPKDAVVDVTQAPYGAMPDDGVDDTEALQRAISEQVGTGRSLYLPRGVYEISRPLQAKTTKGLWEAHLTLQGAGRDETVLKLTDGAKAFSDEKNPAAVYATGSHWQEGDSPDGGGNKAFRNNVFDLTIDVGRNNPGAIGIDWAVSNQGAIRDVKIVSRDRAVAGISMSRRIPGPGLIKDVEIEGFQTGIDMADIQYGLTVENLRLAGQSVAGIRTDRNILHVRNLQSLSDVPAVQVTDILGVLTLLDSTVAVRKDGAPNIVCAGTLLMRGVQTSDGGQVKVLFRGAESMRDKSELALPKALGDTRDWTTLPAEETPSYWNPDLSEWVAVGPRQGSEPDDTAAIQRAMQAGKPVVYFPIDRTYFLSDTVEIGGAVRQVLGFGSEISLGAAEKPFSDRENPRPLFRVVPGSGKTLFIENVFFNAQYPGQVIFENDSPSDLVLKHLAGWIGGSGMRRSYQNTDRATGKLFVEDAFLPGWDFRGQRVWARQFNPENPDSDGTTPQVRNSGGKLWILGFKTEGAAPFITTREGGVTELRGAYNYISATAFEKLPEQAVPYISEDSRISLTFTSDNFRESDYAVYIRQVTGEKVIEVGRKDLPPRNGTPGDRSLAVPLYR